MTIPSRSRLLSTCAKRFQFLFATFVVASAAAVTNARAQDFVHPGGLHTQADLERMKAKVAAGEHPWIDGWNMLIADRRAQNTWRSGARANMGANRGRAQEDAVAAYLNAMRWHISGDTSFAECAVRILNGWSGQVKEVPSGRDQPGLGGIFIGSFAVAAEVLRTYPGWSAGDQQRFKKMLREYCYPVVHSFLTTHSNSKHDRFWANWDTANILALIAMGVFCDDRAIFNEGVEYFKTGKGMGAIKNAVPFVYPGGLGQWQESGRDHAHAMGGQGLLVEACQVAWNQGVDLFGYDNNRLLAGAEYEAQFNLWKGVPYTFYTNSDNANQYYISENYHGRLDASHFELVYNHYVVRKGLKAPHVKFFAELKRPEPGDIDVKGYGTLTYTLDATASPYPAVTVPPVPQDLTATAGLNRVDLKWSPSGAYSTKGYEVSRATASEGPYTNISSTDRWTTPLYTDTKVTNGATYFYKVAAMNQSGRSQDSAPVSATPIAGGPLPKEWTHGSVGKTNAVGSTTYGEIANGSFVLDVAGAGINGAADDCNYAYQNVTGDFTITARLIGRSGRITKMGLMMRESPDPNAKMLAMTLGELGGRQARFGTRSSTGGTMTTQLGNDYTWMPVWFRLQRVGDTFTAFQSSDGVTWFAVGKSSVPMARTYLAGLAGSSGKPDETGKVAFDNVITAVTPPPLPAAPGELKAAASGNSAIQLTWKNNADNRTGFKIEASSDNALFYEIANLDAAATSFVNTGLKDLTQSYRVRAYNTGGYSPYSNAVSVAPSTETSSRP